MGALGQSPTNWGPSRAPPQSQKQLLGLRLQQEGGQVSPHPGKGDPVEGEV